MCSVNERTGLLLPRYDEEFRLAREILALQREQKRDKDALRRVIRVAVNAGT